jgi:hypothetical protein
MNARYKRETGYQMRLIQESLLATEPYLNIAKTLLFGYQFLTLLAHFTLHAQFDPFQLFRLSFQLFFL